MFHNHMFLIYHHFRLHEHKKNIKCEKIYNEYKDYLLKYDIKLPN